MIRLLKFNDFAVDIKVVVITSFIRIKEILRLYLHNCRLTLQSTLKYGWQWNTVSSFVYKHQQGYRSLLKQKTTKKTPTINSQWQPRESSLLVAIMCVYTQNLIEILFEVSTSRAWVSASFPPSRSELLSEMLVTRKQSSLQQDRCQKD